MKKMEKQNHDILEIVCLWVRSNLLYFFYVVWRYKVTATLSGSKKVTGYANIALYGSDGNTRQHQIIK